MANIFDFLYVIFNEIRSYFVPERVSYEITGECKKCGKGKDEDGNLIFACKLVTKDGLCSDYAHRLPMCRKYPAKRIFYPAKLHDGCGYKVNIKSFKDYLNKK